MPGFLRRADLRTGDAWRLTLISFLSLYFELTLIRWIPTQVRLLAYFTNFVLIAALLGLGIGMLMADGKLRLVTYLPVGLLALILATVALERSSFVLPIVSGGWFYFVDLRGQGGLAYLVLVGFFLVMVGVFALIGQDVGRAMHPFRRPLTAYSLNILGSLCGVLGFALLSRLEVPPTLWFAIGAAAFLLYLISLLPWRAVCVAALPLALVVGAVHADEQDRPANTARYWSPYYEVEVAPNVVGQTRVGYNVRVNKDNHQYALDLSGRFARYPTVEARRRLYNLPYRLVHPRSILVLGAGTGNDVTAALYNAPHATIDAVEIDPVIARLGKQIHPDRPYSSPRVHLHVDDARSFLQRTRQKYDLIVFGLLDSHRVFSQMSSVRLDNFVYTREDFETVRRDLTPGGMVALTFSVPEEWIANRIFSLLNHVFGRAPLVYQGNSLTYGTMFLASARHLSPPADMERVSRADFSRFVQGTGKWTWRYTQVQGFLQPADFSTSGPQVEDDWPYLYLNDRTIPPNYMIVLVLTALVSLLLVWLTVPRIDFRSPANWNFFLLGAAFALQETKGITDIALLFGSTWITNIIVISAILLVILLANLVVSHRSGSGRGLPLPWIYLALCATLVLNYLVPLQGLLEYGFWIQVFGSGLRVAAPLFFSGIVFARWFAATDKTSAALGSNLMGAVMGSLVEYSSLVLGLRDLYLLALLFYLLSFGLTYSASLRRARINASPVSSRS